MVPREQTVEKALFGCFEVNLATGEVFKNGRKLRLSGQPAEVLVILLEHAGRLVTREELRERLWREETFVDFDHGLNNCINRIRDVLGDSAAAPEWIETLPKRGYRFIAPIRPVEEIAGETRDQLEPPVAPGNQDGRPPIYSSPFRSGRRRRLAVAFFVGAAALSIGVVFAIRGRTPHSDSAVLNITAIAVLPLANLSGDSSQDYLTDGLTDELIIELARNMSVPVISRTSIMWYKNKQIPLPVIARELGVDAVVEGSLQRTQNHFTISTHLIAAQTDMHLWAANYEADMSQLPQVASQVASDLSARLRRPQSVPSQRPRIPAVSAEAYEQYLKGQSLWNSGQSEAALRHFQQAVALEPNYAAAYGGIAKSYCRMEIQQVIPPAEVYPQATAAVQKALSLDPHTSDAHAALSYLYAQRDWDYERAEQELKTVIAEDPGTFVGHRWYRYILHQKGRHREALEQARLSLKADPASAFALMLYARELEDNGNYDQAITAFSDSLDFDANDADVRSDLSDAYEKTAKLDLAAVELEKSLRLSAHPDLADRFHKQVPKIGYRRAADNARHASGLRDLDHLKKKAARGEYVSPSA